MPIAIAMPQLSPTMAEGTLTRWLKQEGEAVSPGDVIAEIETDKATMEIEAVDEGILAKILVPEGAEGIAVGATIAVLLEEGEDRAVLESFVAPAVPAAPGPAAPPAEQEAEPAEPAPTEKISKRATTNRRRCPGNSGDIPRLAIIVVGKSVTMDFTHSAFRDPIIGPGKSDRILVTPSEASTLSF